MPSSIAFSSVALTFKDTHFRDVVDRTKRFLLAAISYIVVPLGICGIADPCYADSILKDPMRSTVGLRPPEEVADVAGLSACQDSAKIPKPLSLVDAAVFSLCHNPQSKSAWANILSQAALVGASRAAYLPNVVYSKSINNLSQRTSFPGFSAYTTSIRTTNGDQTTSLTWILYDFGLRAANREYAREVLRSATATQDATIQNIFFKTAQAFYTVQAAQAAIQAARNARDVARESDDAATAMSRAGIIGMPEKLQIDIALAQASSREVQAAGAFQDSLGDLADAMGVRPDSDIELGPLDTDDIDTSGFQKQVADLINVATKNHPKILASEAQVLAAAAQVRVAKAGGRPTIELVASLERDDTPLTVSQKEVFHDRAIGVQIKVPIFEGFGRAYTVRQAAATEDEKEQDLRYAKQEIALEVWKSYHDVITESDDVRASQNLFSIAQKSFQAAKGQFRSGYGDVLALLKAQSDLASADQQQIGAIAKWQIARLRLAASVGMLGIDDLK
jgi:outer membrane protein